MCIKESGLGTPDRRMNTYFQRFIHQIRELFLAYTILEPYNVLLILRCLSYLFSLQTRTDMIERNVAIKLEVVCVVNIVRRIT